MRSPSEPTQFQILTNSLFRLLLFINELKVKVLVITNAVLNEENLSKVSKLLNIRLWVFSSWKFIIDGDKLKEELLQPWIHFENWRFKDSEENINEQIQKSHSSFPSIHNLLKKILNLKYRRTLKNEDINSSFIKLIKELIKIYKSLDENPEEDTLK